MDNPSEQFPEQTAPSLPPWRRYGRAILVSRRLRRGIQGFLAALALLGIFGLLGYFWLPGILQSRLELTLSETLRRPVTLERIEIQPYALKATLHGLRVGNRDGDQALAGFASLEANLSMASSWNRGVVLDALRLDHPYVNLVRQEDGNYNISDLVDEFLADREDRGGPFPYAVNNLEIVGGRLVLDDQTRQRQHEITDLHLILPRLASLPKEVENPAQPVFSASLDGAPINLEGQVRPYAATPDGQLLIRFQGLDLAKLAAFVPKPLPVILQSAKLDSDLQLNFAAGEEKLLSLQGNLKLSSLKTRLAGVDGELEQLALKVDAPELLHGPIKLEEIRLQGLSAQRQGEGKAFLELAAVQLDQLSLDPGKHQLQGDTLGVAGLYLAVARENDGKLDLQGTVAEIQAALANKPDPAAPVWNWKLQGLSLKDGNLQFLDKTLAQPIPLGLHGLGVELGELTAGGGEPLEFSLKGQLNERGSLDVSGHLDLGTLAGEVQLQVVALDLVSLQGWLPQHLKLMLTKGVLSAQGQLKFGGSPFRLQYQGDGHLLDLALLDLETDKSLLRWAKLDLTGVSLDTQPLAVKLDDVALSDFFARLMITPQGQLHLGRYLRKGDTTGPGPAVAAAPALMPPPQPVASVGEPLGEGGGGSTRPAPEKEPMAAVKPRSEPIPISIGSIRLDKGTVIFNDLFIKPNYTANLSALSGQVGPLAAGQRGKLKIQGKVEKTAPVVITGELEPFSQELFLDIKAQARGIDMPTFSPYSGRYMGYLIQKGKLSVDVRYHIEKGLLEANNHIFLDQFTLGNQVESPDALSIPIKLGLALLKNSRGEIDIELPISGSLNDPQFSIGGIVFKAILNLLVKAVASPFTLLASIVGGGGSEELSYVDFNPGLATLVPATEKKLQDLTKALVDRPALSLEVTGQADPVADSEGYRRVLLERQVKSRKVADDVALGKSAPNLRDVTLSPEEYEKYLTKLYKEAKFEKPRNIIGLTKGLPVAEMENLLITHMNVDEADFKTLANRRGKVVRDWLVDQGAIPSERIFLMAPEVVSGEPGKSGNRVAFSIR